MAVCLAGCSRESASVPPRIAVLRFENLSPDVSLDWMGRAASEIVAREIDSGQMTLISPESLHANAATQFRPVSAPGESVERSAALAEGATRVVMGQFSLSGKRLLLEITERDAATEKTLQAFTLTSGNPGDVYSIADAAARRLSGKVAPFDSRNNEAIAWWARALEESDYAKVKGDYARAVEADPNFASAWLGWIGIAASHNDRGASEKILADAQQHADRFSGVDRARLKLAAAKLSGDRAATLRALNELGQLRPEDADTVRAVADQNFAARQYQTAASGYRRLSQISPRNPLVWNQLGYALLYSGDYGGAMSALRTYQRLSPKDANPLDSQGDVAFAFGRFAEAEKLYGEAAAKDANFENSADLYKAAEARLMTGDVAGADKKFGAYASVRSTANDPTLAFRVAIWRFISGKHDEAFAALRNLASAGSPAVKTVAMTQIAIWDLQLGRQDRALRESTAALKSGAASPTALIARFASEDARDEADWSARADRLLGAPQLARLKPVALAYALYLSRQWQAAEPLWKQLAEHASPDDSVTPVVYARILVELHRPRDAEPFVRLFPVPHFEGGQEFLSLAIPQVFEVRAAVLDAEGKSGDAEANRKIFRTLSGQ